VTSRTPARTGIALVLQADVCVAAGAAGLLIVTTVHARSPVRLNGEWTAEALSRWVEGIETRNGTALQAYGLRVHDQDLPNGNIKPRDIATEIVQTRSNLGGT